MKNCIFLYVINNSLSASFFYAFITFFAYSFIRLLANGCNVHKICWAVLTTNLLSNLKG